MAILTELRSAAVLVPGSLATRTGGYIYDAHIVDGLRARGWRVAVREVAAGGFSAALASLPAGCITLVDGLLYGAAPEVVEAHASQVRFVPVIHLPLAEDIGLDQPARQRLEASERRALRFAARVVATGPATAVTLETYGVPRASIVLALPGTDAAALAHGTGSPLQILCVATVNAGKGHAMLIRGVASAPTRDWHLTCAGSLSWDPAAVVEVRDLVAQEGLQAHVTFPGELDSAALERLYASADLFALATLKETFGMAIAEAIAHGLPVVSTLTGAVTTVAGESAGVFVEPGNEAAFTHALHRLMTDAPERARVAAQARESRHRLPTWDHCLDKISTALDELSISGQPSL